MQRFIHSVSRLFESDEEREKRELAAIEQRRQARQARQAIVHRAAMLRDRISDAEQQYETLTKPIDAKLALNKEVIFSQWLAENGGSAGSKVRLEDIAGLLSSHDALKRYADGFKDFLRRKTVGVAEQAYSDYAARHREELKDFTLEAADEPPFVHQVLPKDHFVSGASAALVKAGFVSE
jgi:hypothetical protein